MARRYASSAAQRGGKASTTLIPDPSRTQLGAHGGGEGELVGVKEADRVGVRDGVGVAVGDGVGVWEGVGVRVWEGVGEGVGTSNLEPSCTAAGARK